MRKLLIYNGVFLTSHFRKFMMSKFWIKIMKMVNHDKCAEQIEANIVRKNIVPKVPLVPSPSLICYRKFNA